MPLRPLCPELAKKAREELNEDPKTIENDLKHLKDWLSKQPHLRARMDDQWLIAFLRGCKYSLERTKEKLDLYYSMRSLAPELFKVKATDPNFNELLGLGTYLMLPKTATPDSPRVILIRAGSYDPSKYNFLDIFSSSNIIQRILMYDDDSTVISGIKTVMDMEGVSIAHYLQISPGTMKKMTVLAQVDSLQRYFQRSEDAGPIRMKGTHYINTPPGFENIFNLIKTLLNEKNRKRLYVHNKNYEELYKHIPRDILPAEYGGNAGTIKEIVGYWQAKVKDYSSWLEEDLKYGSDESKRVGKPKSAETLFGVDGSFRQLEFD